MCGYDKPFYSVYDFHHKDESTKEFGISGKTFKLEVLKREADKCLLLCRNCHGEVTEKRHAEKRMKLDQYQFGILHKLSPEKKKPDGKTLREMIRLVSKRVISQYFCVSVKTLTKWIKELSPTLLEVPCKHCKKMFQQKDENQKFCSHECSELHSRKVKRPTKEELAQMVLTVSWREIGRQYNVSDNTARKWAKHYKII